MPRLSQTKIETFNGWVKNQAALRGITMADLGTAAGISSPRFSDLTTGKISLDENTLDKIRGLASVTRSPYGKILRLACEARHQFLLCELRSLRAFAERIKRGKKS
jgi:transcriptional regulator with XRE-family HTH domain